MKKIYLFLAFLLLGITAIGQNTTLRGQASGGGGTTQNASEVPLSPSITFEGVTYANVQDLLANIPQSEILITTAAPTGNFDYKIAIDTVGTDDVWINNGGAEWRLLATGSTLPTFTDRSVIYAAPDGSLTENNAGFKYYNDTLLVEELVGNASVFVSSNHANVELTNNDINIQKWGSSIFGGATISVDVDGSTAKTDPRSLVTNNSILLRMPITAGATGGGTHAVGLRLITASVVDAGLATEKVYPNYSWSAGSFNSADRIMQLTGQSGELRLHKYGDLNITGTATSIAGFNSLGRMIEIDPATLGGGGGGTTYTGGQAITLSGTQFDLGSTAYGSSQLTQNRTIDLNGNSIAFGDGTNFLNNFSIDNANGRVGVNTFPTERDFEVSGLMNLERGSGNIGINGLNNTQTGANNIGIGNGAGDALTTGIGNYFAGLNAGGSQAGGSYAVAIGFNAMSSGNLGNTIAIGRQTMQSMLSGTGNTAVGSQAMRLATGGSFNAVYGWNALENNTTGSRNSVFGNQSLQQNTTGSDNFALGYRSLLVNTTGTKNLGLGNFSLFSNIDGNSNIAISYEAMNDNTSGSSNIAIGESALFRNTTGSENIAIGLGAGNAAHESNNNTAVGTRSLNIMSRYTDNTAVGHEAGANSTGSQNVYVGKNTRTEMTADGTDLVIASRSGNTHTVTGHGLPVGATVLAFAVGTPPGAISTIDPYQFRVTDANTLTAELAGTAFSSTGTTLGYTLQLQTEYSNSSAIGNDAVITKDNQFNLPSTTDEVRLFAPVIVAGTTTNIPTSVTDATTYANEPVGTMIIASNGDIWIKISTSGIIWKQHN